MGYPSYSIDTSLIKEPVSLLLKGKRVHCTDSLESGIVYRKPQNALGKKYIAINNDFFISCLVFDIDRLDGAMAWYDCNLPKPNITVTNPKNKHAHLIYILRNPVCISDNARDRPIRYLQAIKKAMTKQLNADTAYNNHLTKNPLHSDWETQIWRLEPYDLAELGDYVCLSTQKADSADVENQMQVIFGRNCATFDYVREWAYQHVKEYDNRADFWDKVLSVVNAYNNSLDSPLPYKEVKSISKSIATWVWRNRAIFVKNKKPKKNGKHEVVREPDFIERQRKKGELGNRYGGACEAGGKARSATYDTKRQQAKEMFYKDLSYAQIASVLGVSRRTIINWAKDF